MPKRPSRPSPARAAEKGGAEEILLAASELFHRAGFDGARADDIALAAGISKPTLYKRFASKMEILQAISEKHHRDLDLRAREIAEGSGAGLEKLEALFKAHFRHTVEHRFDFQVLQSEARRLPDRRAIDRYADEYMRLLRAQIRAVLGEAASAGAVELVARSFLALVNWPGFWFRPQAGELTLQEACDGAWALFEGGFRAAASRQTKMRRDTT